MSSARFLARCPHRFLLLTSLLSSSAAVSSLRHVCPAHLSLTEIPGMTRHITSSAVAMTLKKQLSEWSFADPKLASLPLDQEVDNFVRRNVPKAVFSVCQPTPMKTPRKLVAVNDQVLQGILDMDPAIREDLEFVDFVTGNKILDGSIPLSHRYGGHQFGHWADQLGDGRAHLLGEYLNSRGERWELQLKGSGRTPYSRMGDGRAVLRSSVREFLCSEAMFYLGVPTSRAASLVVTDDPIPRDMFYNGNLKMERGAVVLRLAPTWFRFGSFQILAKHREMEELAQLVDFVLKENFPHILATHPEDRDSQIVALFQEVCEDTAKMIAHWMSVGFAHGVMNTDNMSIKSITIDYGPYGFLDEYDPHFIPNSSDDMGRYDFQNQPSVALWNLQQLALAFKPLVSEKNQDNLTKPLEKYAENYQRHFLELFDGKLGLKTRKTSEDMELLAILLNCLERKEADFTQSFRDLSEIALEDLQKHRIPESAWGLAKIKDDEKFHMFIEKYVSRLEAEATSDEDRMGQMQASNPRYILRNWIAQKAIEMAEKDDFSEVEKLLRILKKPFSTQKEAEEAGYARPPPKWSKQIRVSCSS
eukprot:maker-scaffold9_size846264-snap-gene-6.16 protein:Tk08406 transcript:maker-scaffold9_size846264-snap-gene-6.16-mRNA-1 annotation:"hypothetical protein LOTGIDRAFT_122035"